jgi:hypothetical protein
MSVPSSPNPGSGPSWSALVRVPIDNCLISRGVTVLEQAHGPDVGSDRLL